MGLVLVAHALVALTSQRVSGSSWILSLMWLLTRYRRDLKKEFQHTYRESNPDHPIYSSTRLLLGNSGSGCWCGVKSRNS